MFLIPLGVEGRSVYRIPFTTICLMVANVLVFAVAAPFERAQLTEVDLLASMIEETLATRPYLAVPERFGVFVDTESAARLEEARSRALRSVKSSSPEAVAREQADIDALVADFVARMEALPSRRFGYVPASGSLLDILTAMFMHAGWLHLAGNMLFLYVIGPYVEDVYGPMLFLACYMLSGIAAGLGHAMADPRSVVPVVGASGAIAGLMGISLVRLLRERIRLLFLPIIVLPMVRIHLVVPAFVVLPAWLVQQLVEARFSAVERGGVAWWAHVAGFVSGAGLAIVIKLLSLEERSERQGLRRGTDGLMKRASRAREQGDLDTAKDFLRRLLSSRPNDAAAWREAAELAFATGDAAEVGRATMRVLELQRPNDDPGDVLDLLDDPRWSELPARPPRVSLAIASFFEKRGEAERALEHYNDVIQAAGNDAIALRALLRKGELLILVRQSHAARECLAVAMSHPACRGAFADAVHRALAQLQVEASGDRHARSRPRIQGAGPS